jgi:predicted esterase
MDQNPSFSLAVGVHHIPVQRTARYCSLGSAAANARQLWIGLHGYAMLARSFTRLLAPLAAEGANLVVTPEALSRFYLETERNGKHGLLVGATWLTREDREQDLADSLGYLDQLHRTVTAGLRAEAEVNVLGFSQGAVMAARWVATAAAVPHHLVLWGIVPPEETIPALAERMANREVTLIAGDRDPFAPPGSLEALAEHLARQGVRARAERFDGGHSLSKELLRRLGATGPA